MKISPCCHKKMDQTAEAALWTEYKCPCGRKYTFNKKTKKLTPYELPNT